MLWILNFVQHWNRCSRTTGPGIGTWWMNSSQPRWVATMTCSKRHFWSTSHRACPNTTRRPFERSLLIRRWRLPSVPDGADLDAMADSLMATLAGS